MKDKIDLAIVAIMKNEAPYVKEWIDYHILVGVKKFYIYDNESEDNLKEVLQSYIDNGIVEYTFFPGKERQMPAYNDCLQKHREDIEWLAVIDADEFIVPVQTDTLQQTLKDYKDYAGIGVNWVLYDCNGHIKRPRGGVLENYVRCRRNFRTQEHTHIKSIVQPSKVVEFTNPHYAIYVDNACAVDENKNFIIGTGDGRAFTNRASVQKIRINHYWSKSYEETVAKIERGNADSLSKRKLEECRYLYDIKDYTYDYNMYKYVIKLHGHILRETLKYLYYKCAAIFCNKRKTDDYKIISKSKYFNKKWYFKHYPDVKSSNLDPIEHYIKEGWKLGYNPSKYFDTNAYLRANTDVKKAQMNPLLHYLKYGKKEGRTVYRCNPNMKTYYIVSGGFDPIHEGHIAMIKASAEASDGVIVLANSDAWLSRKKGKNFHNIKTRLAILENLKGVIDVLEFNDDDNSACDGIRKVRAKYPDAHLVFANGGDRGKDNIPETETCRECKVDLAFGVGGDNKANSSSWILERWHN